MGGRDRITGSSWIRFSALYRSKTRRTGPVSNKEEEDGWHLRISSGLYVDPAVVLPLALEYTHAHTHTNAQTYTYSHTHESKKYKE